MITRLDLRHFKCFETLKLPLRPLSLLAGGNASGKSSVIQALAVLHQTMREHEWSSRLMLNGATVRLGTAGDVIDQMHGRHACGIGLFDEDGSRFDWEYRGDRDEMSMSVQRASGETAAGEVWNGDGSRPLRHLLPDTDVEQSLTNRLSGLTYLTAERLGPREQYRFDDPQLTPVVGPRGEYAVSVLYSGRDSKVLNGLVMEDVPPARFRQVEARMAQFFAGCVLEIDRVRRANALTLGIRVSADTDFHRPVHTGFGLTQVLPIVVAVLSAKPDDLLLIENPEVHLHPAGQSRMGEFLAEAANAGVQVLIETHSDHILNGIRRAVRKGSLEADAAALYFFRPRHEAEESGVAQVESLAMDADGNIDNWPDGFFDQFDRDMNVLAGWD